MLIDKIKAVINKGEEKDNKRKIENLIVFLVILIVTLVLLNLIWGSGNKKEQKEPSSDPNKKLATTDDSTVTTSGLTSQDMLTAKLEEILEKIEGVGKVKVLITYSQTSQTVPMYNEDTSQKDTQETDSRRWNKKSSRNRCKKRYYIRRKQWNQNTNYSKHS